MNRLNQESQLLQHWEYVKSFDSTDGKMNEVVAELVPGSWERALRAARRTVWKNSSFKEPSDNFKRELCMSEHSPLRLVQYYISIPEIKYWMTAHYTRHKTGVEWFQSTLRDDRHPLEVPRDQAPQGQPVSLDCQMNAAELIFVSRRRLCHMAHKETVQMMKAIVEAVRKVDPIVAEYCVPNCIYSGGWCREAHGCGMCPSRMTYTDVGNGDGNQCR